MGFLCNSFTNKVAGLQSIDKFTENKMIEKDTFQQIFVGLQDAFKTYLEDVLKTSSIKQFLVFQNILRASWKTRNCYDLGKSFF